MNLALLHLCDSLFPVGSFAYSDGLEAATALVRPSGPRSSVDHLSAWLETVLDETIRRTDGPAVSMAWRAFQETDFGTLIRLDQEFTALRPSSSARQSSRAMGHRLLITWHALHPHPDLERMSDLAREGTVGPAFPIAFAAACASSTIARRTSIEGFAYTRLSAAVSAAMRLMPIGQTDAHGLLSRALERVPGVVDCILARDGVPESFTPMMDITAMTQQYLHSRLFRS